MLSFRKPYLFLILREGKDTEKIQKPWSYPFPKGDNCHPLGRDKTMVAILLQSKTKFVSLLL